MVHCTHLIGWLVPSLLAYLPFVHLLTYPFIGSLQMLQSLYRKAKKAQIEPAVPQTGHWVQNFAAFSIHRRKGWVVTVKGFSRYVWDFESSTTQNVYGMYQSHGALQISNSEESLNAYDAQHGWDWTRVPGTTTIKLSLNEMMLPKKRYYQPSRFVGGVVLTSENPRLANGVFAMRFHQPSYGCKRGVTKAWYSRKRMKNFQPVSTGQCANAFQACRQSVKDIESKN